jgi:hypothetical protein
MKKLFSIVMAFVVLMTGLNLSFDSHFCDGKLADVKFSTTGEKATCGMESDDDATLPNVNLFKPICCKDELSKLTVDSNYSPSFNKPLDFSQKVISIYVIPLSEVITDLGISRNFHPNLSPRDVFRDSSVELPAICVFRI